MRMLKPTLTFLTILGAGVLIAFAIVSDNPAQIANANSSGKVTICHKGKTIKVSPFAVSAHLAHGDTKGPCQ